MRKIYWAIVFIIGVAAFCSAEGIAEEARKGEEKAEMSYAFGMVVAADLKQTGLEFNYNSFIRGLRDEMENEKTRYTMNEAMSIIQKAFVEAQSEIAERNLAIGMSFLEENGKRPGVVTTPSGLQYELISGSGSDEKPGPADIVLVHYRGTTIDGTEFDSTYESGEPIEVPLEMVIPGWAEGIRMMSEGDKAKLYVPPNLAYGEGGAGGVIGPNSVLIFEVDLISIVRPDDSENGGEE